MKMQERKCRKEAKKRAGLKKKTKRNSQKEKITKKVGNRIETSKIVIIDSQNKIANSKVGYFYN
jgi:hypothetical protein